MSRKGIYINRFEDFPRTQAQWFIDHVNDPQEFKKIVIIDCRYDHEYEGGHIKNAIKLSNDDHLHSIYDQNYNEDTLFVFYCEFSEHRSPAAIRKFLQYHQEKSPEQKVNACVLTGGYKLFYKQHQDYCSGGYVPEIPPKKPS